jgi:thioredoxin-related protein
MEKKTFRNPAVIAKLNENFISIKVNYDREKRLVSMFKVRGLPDNWFFSKDRKDIKHQPGFISPEKFLVMLKKI